VSSSKTMIGHSGIAAPQPDVEAEHATLDRV
jgi:hypothetical protein